eukprot:1204990-Alexandrium_andersonii.AAC.2
MCCPCALKSSRVACAWETSRTSVGTATALLAGSRALSAPWWRPMEPAVVINCPACPACGCESGPAASPPTSLSPPEAPGDGGHSLSSWFANGAALAALLACVVAG